VATLDIDQMVKEMQTAVVTGVREMERFLDTVHLNVADVGKISFQLARIIERVQALSPSFEAVSEAMEQQSRDAHEINSAVSGLRDEADETIASLRESFSAIEQLNDAARRLQNEVSFFKLK
jgi:methyl-accepting chemotaxis protein WspA